jgi:hypothetical protein
MEGDADGRHDQVRKGACAPQRDKCELRLRDRLAVTARSPILEAKCVSVHRHSIWQGAGMLLSVREKARLDQAAYTKFRSIPSRPDRKVVFDQSQNTRVSRRIVGFAAVILLWSAAAT